MEHARDFEPASSLDDAPDTWGNSWNAREPQELDTQPAATHAVTLLPDRLNPWKGVPRAKRAAIMRALRSDELLLDPTDAQLLVQSAPRLRRFYAKQRAPLRILMRLWAVAWLTWAVVDGITHARHGTLPVSLVFPVLWLAFDVNTLVKAPKRLPQLERAEARHREYLDSIGHPVAAEAATSDAQDPPLRRKLLLSFALCVASVLLLFVVEYMPLLRDRDSSARLAVYMIDRLVGVGGQ